MTDTSRRTRDRAGGARVANPESAAVDAAFKALADSHRRQIMRLVQHRELPAGEIAAHFAMTQQAVSLHLAVLKKAGLVVDRSEGNRRLYRLRHDAPLPVRSVLDEFWPDALGRLKNLVESEHPRPRQTEKESTCE